MRRIVCRFDDESDFLRQFRWEQSGAVDEAADFMFVGDFELDPSERIRLVALVSSNRDQCQLDMEVTDVTPVASEKGLMFKYRAHVAPEDAVWLLAFRQKMSTRRWLQELAA